MNFLKNFKKHKIILSIITFIFSFFLLNNNVFALKTITENNKTIYYLGNSYTTSYYNYDSFKDFIVHWTNTQTMIDKYSSTTQFYRYNSMVNYIKNGTYLSYGSYYFMSSNSTNNGRHGFITNYPEQIKITGMSETSGAIITAYYDPNKPVYYYYPYGTSGYITNNVSFTSTANLDINYTNRTVNLNTDNIRVYPYDCSNIWSNIPEIYISDNIEFRLSDYIFTSNKPMFYGSENGVLSIESPTPKINSLEFKEDIIKKNSYVASNYELTIDNYKEDYNYYFAYSSCINNNSCYNLTQLNTKSKYYDNLGSYNYQEDYLLNINGLIDENGKINISLFTNDTILVLINDKNGNFIESQTFTITEIDEKKTSINKTPYFTVENYTSDSCKIYENETEYKLCTSFEIYINDMSNVHDYILYESLNSADNFKEIGIWNDSASITLYKNGDYAIYKLTDLEGNIIDTITVNAGGLKIFNEDDNEVYFKHETNYNEDTKNAVVRYYFYNYKFDSYKIYYSEDGLCSEFNEITLNYENDIVGSIQKTYKENKTICFKITDLEGNYIKSFTYNLDYFLIIENDENYTTFDYMFDYMKELAKNSTKIFMYMTNVYNKIINSNLGSYVILVIFTCIVILILKALSR